MTLNLAKLSNGANQIHLGKMRTSYQMGLSFWMKPRLFGLNKFSNKIGTVQAV